MYSVSCEQTADETELSSNLKQHSPELYTLLPCRFSAGRKKLQKKLHKYVFILFICVYLFHKTKRE